MGKRSTSQEIIDKIKFLRSQGKSLPEISEALHVPKTTAFRYVKDVQMLPEFVSEWASKQGGSKKRKLCLEKLALEEGKTSVGVLSSRDKLLFISALYWGEGSKKDFGLSNTDPDLIKIFINGLREVFHLSEDRFRISIRVYQDLDREECLDFWSKIVGIPKERFLKVDMLPGKKQGKLRYGMCRVRIVKGGDILKKIMGINKAFAGSMSTSS